MQPLVDHLRWLKLADCTCPFRWQGLGRLHGVSMGKGWVRLIDDPACVLHGNDPPAVVARVGSGPPAKEQS